MTGRFAQQQIKERERRFRRKHRWRLRAVWASLVAVGLSIWLIAPGVEVPLWAVVPAMSVCVLGAGWDQLVGTYSLACGRDAEKWTSDELRKRAPAGSRVVDWIPFGDRDVDHVLVTSSGVYVVETKYTDSVVNLKTFAGVRSAQEWAGQAHRNARSIRLMLASAGEHVDTTPLVVVWGPEVSGAPVLVDGTVFLRGRDLRSLDHWTTGDSALPALQVRRIEDLLLAHRARRLDDDRRQKRAAARTG